MRIALKWKSVFDPEETDTASNMDAFVNAGGITVLISLLRGNISLSINHKVLVTLCHLSTVGEANLRRIVDAGGINSLVEFMNRENNADDDMTIAIDLLYKLSTVGQTERSAIMAANYVAPLLKIVSTPVPTGSGEKTERLERALILLIYQATNPRNHSAFMAGGGTYILLNVLNWNLGSELDGRVVTTVFFLQNNADYRLALTGTRCAASFIRIISRERHAGLSSEDSVRSHMLALEFLSHASEGADNKDAIVESGGIGVLVNEARLPGNVNNVKQRVVKILSDLSLNNPANCRAIREAGGVAALEALRWHPDLATRTRVTETLQRLAHRYQPGGRDNVLTGPRQESRNSREGDTGCKCIIS